MVVEFASFCGRAGVCGLWWGVCGGRVGLVVGGGWGTPDDLGCGGFVAGVGGHGGNYVCAEAGFVEIVRIFL